MKRPCFYVTMRIRLAANSDENAMLGSVALGSFFFSLSSACCSDRENLRSKPIGKSNSAELGSVSVGCSLIFTYEVK